MMNLSGVLKEYNAGFLRAADWLAVALAASLPWSTSATAILAVMWLLMLLPALDHAALRREIMTLAGGLPVLLVALGALGTLWADVPWMERASGFAAFAKLLVIPLMLVQFQRSDRGNAVLAAFLISCTALLAFSLALAIRPRLWGFKGQSYGVPVKDYIAQSGEFVICAFATAFLALDCYRTGRHMAAIAFSILAAVFLFDVLYIATGRTALVTFPFLLVLLAARRFGWKRALGICAVAIVLGSIVWPSSPYLQRRVTGVGKEIQAYLVEKKATSAGERIDFWKKSLGFIAETPLIGHGTGSIKQMFEKAAVGESGPWARPAVNPHNQTLAVGVQIGLLGMAVLWAMWLSHLRLFRGEGLLAWVGLVVVVQNIVGSLFNSHLFDFNQGWLYVVGVGVAGGAVLRGNDAARRIPASRAASASARLGADGAQRSEAS